jgi:tRNA1Val (adenine37-N6)-methyltransferase
MEPFHFKHFSLEHGSSPMPIGVDSVLLGSWVQLNRVKNILDIGTGCGLLSFMCAQKNSNCNIIGIDISQSAIDEAVENAKSFPLSKKIGFKQISLIEYTPEYKIDFIISNPPFFDKQSQQSKIEARANARHNNSLNLADLFDFASHHLSSQGKMALVLPIINLEEVIELSSQLDLHLTRLATVFPKVGKSPHRIAIEVSRTNTQLQESDIFIRDEKGKYTTQYIALTEDFYR